MVTDPPYGVGLRARPWRSAPRPSVFRASLRTAKCSTMIGLELAGGVRAIPPGMFAYILGTELCAGDVRRRRSWRLAGLQLRAQILWVKQHFALSRGRLSLEATKPAGTR